MKLEDIFSLNDYLQCVEKLNQNLVFENEYKSKNNKLKFTIGLFSCDNGVWENGLYRVYDMCYENGGFSHPFGLDEDIPRYERLCKDVNEQIERVERQKRLSSSQS